MDDNIKNERQKEEAHYHDNKVLKGEQNNRRNSQSPYYQFFEELIGEIKGLNILDLGCGDGWFSINLVNRGARVWGIDISHELLKLAMKHAINQGVSSQVHFAQMAAEDLAFPNNFFDMAIGSAILHHTNIELTTNSIDRVLKDGGRAVFVEPMNENILLKIWRKLTPWRRSPYEKALTTAELFAIKKSFPHMLCRYFGLLSIISEGLMILFPQNRVLEQLDKLLSNIDSYLLKRFPSLGKYCAVVVMDLKK